MGEAAEYFIKEAVRIDQQQELHILEVINYSSKQHDRVGKKIETEVYFALERLSPDFKLFLGKGPNKDKEIYLAGTYEIRENKTIVKLRIFKGNEIIAQKEVDYDSKSHRKTLVAVLDLEAKTMNEVQRKTFSDIFRAAFNEIGAFDMASSADIDKMNPDEIQRQAQCTRDECATIIGEQLGVDRVISSSLNKIDENFYFLSAKMMDIIDGSILMTKVVEHNGSLRTLRTALESLALQIAQPTSQEGVPISLETIVPIEEQLVDSPKFEPSTDPVREPIEPVIQKDSGWPWWYYAVAGALLAGAAAGDSGDSGSSSGSGGSNCQTDKCGGVVVTW